MFGFMKKNSEKEREEKDRKKKEKKDKRKRTNEEPLTQEELLRLEEAKRGLLKNMDNSRGDGSGVYTSTARMDITRTVRVPPPTHPKPKPKKGILKDKSHYGPEIPNQGVRGNLDDTGVLEENTNLNEILPGELGVNISGKDDAKAEKAKPQVRSRVLANDLQQSQPIPPRRAPRQSPLREQVPDPVGPDQKIYENIDLQLPSVAPPRSLKPRALELKRQTAGDFGFTLRRGTVLERGGKDSQMSERKRTVIFAEPGPKNMSTGLLPGDRLIEVNGSNVENSTREEIIELIKKSGYSVTLKVQPIPELSELSMRSGLAGEDVPIGEQGIKGSTLKRSGSMRYKSRQTKSDDQLATEKEWLQAEKVWLVHKGGFAASRMIRESVGKGEESSDKVKVKLDFGGEVLEVEDEDVEKSNPPQYDRVEDLAALRFLNESSLLHTLRQRYGSNLIHTYAGPSILIVNPMHPLSIYSEKVIQMFKGCKAEDMPPHIYAAAQIGYRNLLNSRQDQSIVFLGRSGAGKTTNARHVMHYLNVAAGSINNVLTVDKLNCVFALLDAFGNSRTVMNTNATRYTQMISLNFDHAGQIGSAAIQVLMLEKMRIAKRPEGEPTFHVFYQMLAGIDANTRKDLQLENMNEPNLFMTPLQRAEDRQKASQSWNKILHALNFLNVTEAETKGIVSVLAAIFHLGVAGTVKGANNKYQFGRPAAAQRVAAVLGTTIEELSHNIFSCTGPQGRSPIRGAQDNQGDTLSGLEALEGFAVGLYNEVFHALVSLINRSLSTSYRTTNTITILDGPGFQNPASCGRPTGASFDDLCHNYVQERLQLLFHDVVFTSQQDLYSQENVEVDFDPVTTSPAPVVALIDKPPSQPLVRGQHARDSSDAKGLLWLLDETAIYPGSTEGTFIEHVKQNHTRHSDRPNALLRMDNGKLSFVLNHFQGTNPVTYNAKGWLKASRENPVCSGVTTLLHASHKEEVKDLFGKTQTGGTTVLKGSLVGTEGTSSLRRASSIRRTFTSSPAGLKRKSIALQVKFQVDSMVEVLRKTRIHFVHCLLPQHNAGLSDLRTSQLAPNKSVQEDVLMNVPLVRSQVRGLELVDAIRFHRQGFPEHMQHVEFIRRFAFLGPSDARASEGEDEKVVISKLLQHLEIDSSMYRTGLSQVFFRAGGLSQLEDLRDERISDMVVNLQAYSRGYLERKKLDKLRFQHLAVSCIQKNVRKWMAIREWPWWRLYTKVQPLLNVQRTEEELKDREVELDQIKAKYEKMEKERTEYKQAFDVLQSKMDEMSADLAEEQTTSNQAADVLETEQAERMRLEKDLRDLSAKHEVLVKKHELTEMDLYQAQMIAAELDGEMDDMDGEGDSIFREKFLRAQREIEMLKKRLEQQQEEAEEQQGQLKSSMQRKLNEAYEDADDQQRQASNLKKKSNRIGQEMSDLRLHLEEQMTRNGDLEKKQRKFDHDLLKVTDQLAQEQAAREKVQREKDDIAAQKFTTEQELKNFQMDYEMASDKAKRLENEVQDMMSVSKDDKEILTVKRQKNELDRKCQDQEEELDEQAGTIQQLEQAKLRLEMAFEKLRQQHAKDLDEKEVEMEEVRASTAKRLKALEGQMEEEYEQRQKAVREKRELERKLQLQLEQIPEQNRDVERQLRRSLRHTKTLLADSQSMLQRQKDLMGNRPTLKQLNNQLEDAEYATAAAIKARKGVEIEVTELQAQLDSMSKAKAEVEARCLALTREKNEISAKLEDVDEDYNELFRKYQAAVKQQSVDTTTISSQSRNIEDLLAEIQSLKEQILQLESRCQYHQESMVDKQLIVRLEGKIREAEAKFDLENEGKKKAESHVARLKSSVEQLGDQQKTRTMEDSVQQDVARRSERQLREAREELAESRVKEEDALQKKQDLEKKFEALEDEYAQSQSDLKLSFKRIADLQAALEDSIETDSEDDSYLVEYESGSEGYDDENDDLDLDYPGSNRDSMA